MKQKKCKICPELFLPRNTTQVVCSPKCAVEYNQRQKEKKWKEEKKKLSPTIYAKEYKIKLQRSINRLAKLIDAEFGYHCIDCNKPFGSQIDAGHYHSVGSNSSLRYNLHNIHSQRAQPCNQWQGGKKKEYYEGLVVRYGQEYADYIDKELPVLYKEIKLSATDVIEKYKIVNKLIKNFPALIFHNGREARIKLNIIIGIY